jgi:hypothetical protein
LSVDCSLIPEASNPYDETDSAAVTAILKHPGDDKLAIIGMKLSELGVCSDNLFHVPGKRNAVADWASRVPASSNGEHFLVDKNVVLAATSNPRLLYDPQAQESAIVTRKEQRGDPELRAIYDACKALRSAKEAEVPMKGDVHLRDIIQRFRITNGLLMRMEYASEDDPDSPGRLVVVVPKTARH